MGIFDFVRNAGAKVGIGKSTDEIAAEEAAETERRAEIARKRAEAIDAAQKRAAAAEKAAKDAEEAEEAAKKAEAREEARAEARKKATAARKKAQAARRVAEAKERFAERRRSTQLENYVRDLGIKVDELDVRFDDGVAFVTGEVADQQTRERLILAIGNAEGVAKVDEEIAVEAESDEAEFHTVESGDTLWAIAQRVYGDGNRYPEIFEANRPMLSNPDLIYPGQVLRIPK